MTFMDVDSGPSSPSHIQDSVRRRPRPRPRSKKGYSFVRDREMDATPRIDPTLITWIEGNTLRRLDSGRYVSLDRAALLVRSTISIAFSHDGKYFASTHGDHTVKVFEYPSGKQIACLDGHPRTPWTVRFHPNDSSIVASGCLGSECRVWNIKRRECIRKHNFRASISCVSFSPDGTLLAVTSGRSLSLWDYMERTRNDGWSAASDAGNGTDPGLPRELLEGVNPFHMVDFHPSGNMLMTGEKNKQANTPAGTPSAQEEQFTLKLVIHRFDRRIDKKFAEPVLVVPRAVAYNDAGIHFSPCGTMLAACIPTRSDENTFHIAVLSLIAKGSISVGAVLYQAPLDKGHVTALTNLKFSSTSKHLLAGFSFRPDNPVLRGHAEHYEGGAGVQEGQRRPQLPVVDIYHVSEKFELIRSLCVDVDVREVREAEDEINVAVFAPVVGVADGVVYGTQKGRIRMFQQATGPASSMAVGGESREEWTEAEGSRWPTRELPPLPPTRASSTAAQAGTGELNDIPARHNSV